MRLFTVDKAFDQFIVGETVFESERQPRGDQDREYTRYLTSVEHPTKKVGVKPLDISQYLANGTLKELPKTSIDDGE